ncbi:hypothetical protein [Pleomorphovibrio marinus]|uniref:hypothetical protein n=1 Tax=Pleomorphovibrio marinus TaxID=2164132 RepID=UPI000E0A5FDB|nr:hypothetical protein [Pleomorphovibrio marinus]
MKNQAKLIWANVFALVSVLAILAIVELLEIGLTTGTEGFLAKSILLIVPQLGFVYYLLRSKSTFGKKALA